jgi:hypothetical protein
VLVSIHRFWRRANEGSSDSPLEALRADGVLLLTILLFIALLVAVLFVPAVGAALDDVFLAHASAGSTA